MELVRSIVFHFRTVSMIDSICNLSEGFVTLPLYYHDSGSGCVLLPHGTDDFRHLLPNLPIHVHEAVRLSRSCVMTSSVIRCRCVHASCFLSLGLLMASMYNFIDQHFILMTAFYYYHDSAGGCVLLFVIFISLPICISRSLSAFTSSVNDVMSPSVISFCVRLHGVCVHLRGLESKAADERIYHVAARALQH